MNRNDRRAAREAKHFTAYGIDHTRPIRAAGVHFNAANDSEARCLRCGREGHSSDECKAPLPAWPVDVAQGEVVA